MTIQGTARFAAAVMIAAGIATGAAPDARAQAKEPVTFGVALPTTGSAAPFGQDQLQAIEWAVADINAAGGANGRMLKLVALDTQANPQVGIDVVTRLASIEKVPMLLVGWSAVVAAVAPVVNRSQVLSIVMGANSPRIATMGDYVYTGYPLADVDVNVLAKYARQELKKERAAVIYLNDESGVYGARIFREAFEKLGGKVVAFESYEPNSTDYTGAVLKLRAANPDHVHLHGNAGDSPQAIQQMRQLGIKVPITSYSAAYNPGLVKQIGTQADGLIVSSLAPGPWDEKAVATFVEKFKAAKGRDPNNLPAVQYVHDTAYIFKALVEHLDKKGEPITGANARKALLEVKTFQLPLSGTLTFNEDHTVRKGVYILEVKDAKFTPVRLYE